MKRYQRPGFRFKQWWGLADRHIPGLDAWQEHRIERLCRRAFEEGRKFEQDRGTQ